MELDYEKIKATLNAEYGIMQQRKEQENIDFIRNADIAIFIKVSDDYDRYSLADRIDDILDDIPSVEDVIMYIN